MAIDSGGGQSGGGPATPSGASQSNAWFPAAVVSLVLPGIGLLLLTDKDRKRTAFAILGLYLVGHVALSVLVMIFAGILPLFATLLWIVQVFFALVMHAGSMVYTHDEVVRAHPNLGQPILFRQSIEVPMRLR